MARQGARQCQCGCGTTLTGRANRQFVNATHKKRGQRFKIKPGTSGGPASSHTGQPDLSPVSNTDLSPVSAIRAIDPMVTAKRAIFDLIKQERWDDLSDLHLWLLKKADPGYHQAA